MLENVPRLHVNTMPFSIKDPSTDFRIKDFRTRIFVSAGVPEPTPCGYQGKAEFGKYDGISPLLLPLKLLSYAFCL